MTFIPLQGGDSAGFPRVTPSTQEQRDVAARQLVENETEDASPEDQETLRHEYRLRFGGETPAPQRGFIPIASTTNQGSPARGFVPTPKEPEKFNLLKTIALENPLTAIGETALNLGSQLVALPAAGWAGLATVAGNALGLTDRDAEDVVHSVGNALTYHPRGEFGKGATEIVTYPFQKLAEAGQYVGGKVLDATGSPTLATTTDTAINALPMVVGIRGKAAPVGIRTASRLAERAEVLPAAMEVAPVRTGGGFTPLTENVPESAARTVRTELVDSQATIQHREAQAAADALPNAKTVDEAIALAEKATDIPVELPSKVAVDVPAEIPAGRLSNKVFTDDLLEHMEHEATPKLRQEIGLEQRRRQILAEDMANKQAMSPGSNYVPLIDDATLAHDALVEPRREPLRREDVLIPLIEALDTTIYEGRIKGKGTLGLYTPGKETVRIKRASDIEVAAHEIAHLLDDRIPEISLTWKTGPLKKAYADELRGVSYDKKSIKEGFAEFVRLYMTQPAEAAARAPEFSKWFDGFTERHPYGKAIRKAQADMTDWFGQTAIDRARSKIGAKRNFNEAFDGFWDRFRQSTADDLHGLYRMERDLKGEITPAGAYETARLSRASHSIAEGTINFGHPVRKADGSITFSGKGLRQILEGVSGNLDDALLYFVGRSAQELMMQGREHLFTKAEIRSMLDLGTPEAKDAFTEYQKWNKGVVDFAEAAGVINPAARSMWQRQNYMPFHRVGQPGEYRSKPGDWSGIKALTGGTENIRDLLGNMVANATMLVDKALKNEARQKIAALAESETGAGKFLTKIDTESRPVRIDGWQVLDSVLKTLGVDARDPAMADIVRRLREQIEANPEAFEFTLNGQPPAGSNVVAVLHGGKPTYYEVADPVLYRALSAIDRPHQQWLVKWLGLPKRIGQTTITLTPDFMVANIARDTIMGGVMSRAGFRPIMDSLEGMRLRLTNDPLYRDYIANGGGLSSIYLDEGKLRTRLEKFYQRKGIDYRTVLDTPEKLLGFVETMADAFETSTRLGEYKRAVIGGENPRHAAYLAREVSTDFAMRGDNQALNFMYDTVMFLKPAVLSIDRLYRGVSHDPNKMAIASKAGMVGLFSIGLYLLNRDDPRYQDLKDWERDTYWHFFIGDRHFRYPKIWEIGAMASVAERSVEKMIDGNPGDLAKDFVRIVGQTFNLNLMPQILAPIYEQATNENSFTKARIETPGMENEQPFLRAKPNTSETLKAAGMATRNLPESLQVNPVRAEALLRGYFNTWALYGLALSDRAFFPDQLPESRMDQLPVIRRFYSQDPPQSTKYESMYYDMLGEVRRLHGTLRALDKMGRSNIANEMENNPMAHEYRPLERANERVRDINVEMREVRRSDLTPEEKRHKLDALAVARNSLLKSVVLELKAAQGER